MKLEIYSDKTETSREAANKAAFLLDRVIEEKGKATVVMATGMSQLDFIRFLIEEHSVDWSKVELFHLDEYVGLTDDHPASLRHFLKKHFLNRVSPGEVHFVKGESDDPEAECDRLNELIESKTIDVSLVGIGENGHLAFNDPPADFETEKPFIVVELDQKCREQQVGEGWFETVEEVPERAISMSINQIMESKGIVCTVPAKRKAKAVKNCFEGEITPECPASILRKHENTYVYLDEESSSLLDRNE